MLQKPVIFQHFKHQVVIPVKDIAELFSSFILSIFMGRPVIFVFCIVNNHPAVKRIFIHIIGLLTEFVHPENTNENGSKPRHKRG